MAGFPIQICAWCPECNKHTVHKIVGEHGPYLVYECVECGRHLLIPKGDAFKFTDFGPCTQP